MGAIRCAGLWTRGRLNAKSSSNTEDAPWRGAWSSIVRRAPTADLVRNQPDPQGRRLACLNLPTSTAVVLGSTQQETDVDLAKCCAQSVPVVRRRSGGGAVLIVPRSQIWIDLFLPADDPLFEHDIVKASHWVGQAWRASLARVTHATGPRLQVHDRLEVTRWSRQICFSGSGPGEVSLDGKKIVGLSQRRGRPGAWFFSMAVVKNEQRDLTDLLAFDLPEDRREAADELALSVGAIGDLSSHLEREFAVELAISWSAGEDVPAEPHPGEADR